MSIATALGLRKKTFREKVRDMSKSKLLLYSGLALGAAFGMRRIAPMVAGMIAKH